MKDIKQMSADEYGALLQSSAGGVIPLPEAVPEPEFDLMPAMTTVGVYPTAAETAELEQEMGRFLAAYSQLAPSDYNAKTIAGWLKARKAKPTFRNLVTAFQAVFSSLEIVVTSAVSDAPPPQASGDYRDKQNAGKKQHTYYGMPMPAPKAVQTKTATRIVKGGDLSATEHSKLMQPSQGAEAISLDKMSSVEFAKVAFSGHDQAPDIILRRVEDAIRQFRSKFPDYEPTTENRAIMEDYLNTYKCDRANPQSYELAFLFYKKHPKTKQYFESPIDPVTYNNTTIVTRDPHHGQDPAHPDNLTELTPTLRRKLRMMDSVTFYEWCSQNPELKKKIDESGL